MKVLIVNKFLYPNGGSETYIFEIGKQLEKLGHEVQFFGMEHKGRIVGNKAGAYTSDMDFHTSKIEKLRYPFKIIYSSEAKKQIRRVLDDMKPDVVHLNNINFQITPSIIDEIILYRKRTGRNVKIVSTAHDYQWICPNHMMRIPQTDCNCDKCIGGRYKNCIKNKCIHGSTVKSMLGAMEARLYRMKKTYTKVDTIICPSVFLCDHFKKDEVLKRCNLVAKHNFFLKGDDFDKIINLPKKDYVLYFGRYSGEKGIQTLINAAKSLPEIPFVFAGSGPLENELKGVENIENRGFLSGEELHILIREARFAIYPSEWYENCPFAVMEAISYGTPVIGARIGGIPELIGENGTGLEFVSGDVNALTESIHRLWNDIDKQTTMEENCKKSGFDTVESYTEWLIDEVYR
ncbi:MAG: glycosyltransferase [Lachnospiraceae bacterium]|nr:glycosyltransferase [Lachnospiraceae bacterium]